MIGLIIAVIIAAVIAFIVFASLYTIVPANYADVVIQGRKIRVFSSQPEYGTEVTEEDGKGKPLKTRSAYFKIPSWFFIGNVGMEVHRIPLNVIPINVPDFLAFDKDRARFVCNIIAYVTVKQPVEAAKRFSGKIEDLTNQVSQVVQATIRDVTTKRPIREIINDRKAIIDSIQAPLTEVLSIWGLDLKDIELIDFKDPNKQEHGEESHVIADISSIIEQQINSEMRQKNAEQIKTARLKEAESEELAKIREISKEQEIAKREQEKNKFVAVQQKIAREAELDVEQVNRVKLAQIDKEKAIVQANQAKEVEEINKLQKQLVGQGTRLQREEEAKGEAAPIREKGYAEADAKEKLQAALNKFQDAAIRALVAEKIVAMQQAVGVAGAEALKSSQMRVFAGSDGDKAGFDVGKILQAITVSNDSAAESVLNRLARPNDLGIMLGNKQAEPKAEEKQKGK
jgi:flotillin